MRDKTYDGWTDWKESWRAESCIYRGPRAVKIPFSRIMELCELWWQSNPNPHGWNTSTRAKYAKGFKP